jgi:transposase InsO family protein
MNAMNKQRDRDAWARLRFAIIGPLLSTPPTGRHLQSTLRELSERDWIHPISGLETRFGVSTIERWLYLAQNSDDPMGAMRRKRREDAGVQQSLSPSVIAAIHASYARHPYFSVQLHHANLVAASELDTSIGRIPSYSTLKRYFRRQGLVKKPKSSLDTPGARQAQARLEALEVRSFEVDHTFALWHLDFHDGSRRVLEKNGRWIKPKLLGVLDDHSRLCCHAQWYRAEDTEALVHGFSQAIAKRGLPRALMTDNGSAMISSEFTQGLHTLGIVHERTLPRSAYQNGKQETLWATLEGRLMAMISDAQDLTLEQLNLYTQLWVEQDYHQNRHSELGSTPLRRFLDAPSLRRDAPDSNTLRGTFRQHVTRRQRRSDGTVSLEGKRFEIPSRFGHLQEITLSYARWNLAQVQMIDPDTGVMLSRVYPLDKSSNASGQRRARQPQADTAQSVNSKQTPIRTTPLPSVNGLCSLMSKHVRDHIDSGRPPGYVPSPGAPDDNDIDVDTDTFNNNQTTSS